MGAAELDDLLIRLGVCGWFPFGIFCMQMISGTCACFLFLGNAMATFTPKFWCENLDVYAGNTGNAGNESTDAIVWTGLLTGKDVLANLTQKEICDIGCRGNGAGGGGAGDGGAGDGGAGSWAFETPISHSIAAEWGLVCERQYLLPMTETFFYVGGLVGCIFIGYLSDAFGRRKVVIAAAALNTVAGLQVLWIGNVYLYIAIR